VAIVDTPGFDDTTRSDAEIMEQIVSFLCAQYQLGIPLKGIIYLHRITDNRMAGSAQRYFEMFKCLCGERNLKNVVLLTTMWSELSNEAQGLQRERQLRKEFWKDMEQRGSTIRRFDGSRTSAEAFICRLVREKDIVLDIQHELVDQDKILEDTAAGQWILPSIQRTIGESGRNIERLHTLIEEADDQESDIIDLKKQHDEALEQQRRSLRQRNRLRKQTGREVGESIEVEKKKDKWKSRLAVFGTILGIAVTATVNIILPLTGVSLFA
jgi:hypothetical protein